MKKLLPLLLLLISFVIKNNIQAQSYVDFQNAVYYTASGNVLTSSGQTLANFDYGTALPSHPIFNDGIYFQKTDYQGHNVWLRVQHIANDPNGAGVGYNVTNTGSSPFRADGFGGWWGFLYQFEVYADATLTGTVSNTLGGLYPSNMRVESIETLSAGEWLSFENVNSESSNWSLNSIGAGSNPGFSTTGMYYGAPGFSSNFPNGSKNIYAIDLGGAAYASFVMSAQNVSQFKYGYEYPDGGGYQGIRVYLGNAALPSVSIALTQGTNPGCPNEAKTFTASPVNEGPTPTYEWKRNGVVVGSNSPNYSVAALANNDVITCKMTTVYGDVVNSNAITFTDPTSVSIALTNGTNPNCPSASQTFTASVANTCGVGILTYQWKQDGANVGTNSPTFTSSTIPHNAVITCQVATNLPSTLTSNAITVSVLQTPSLSIASNPAGTICAGTDVLFTATASPAGSNLTYQWKLNDVNVGNNYIYYSNASLANNDVVKCEVNNGCNTVTNSITMSVYTAASLPPTSISTDATNNVICTGSNITLTANGTPLNGAIYKWYDGYCSFGAPVGTGQSIQLTPSQGQHTYYAQLEESVCKSACANIAITANPSISSVDVTSNASGTVCAGTNVTFTASVANGGINGIYQWKLNDVNVGFNSPTYSNTALQNNDVVKCVVSNGCNIVTSNSITTSVNVVPSSVTISMWNNQSTTICQGGYAAFTAVTTNSGAHPTYKWKKNGVVVQTYSGLFTDNTSFYDTYNLNNNDVVTCEMTSQIACTLPVTSNGISMNVNPNPTVSIALTTGTNPDCSGEPLTFTATPVNGGNNISYEWHLTPGFPAIDAVVGTNSPTFTLQNPTNNDVVRCDIISTGVCSSPIYLSSNSITVKAPTFLTGYINCNSNCNGSGNTSTCGAATVEFHAISWNVINSFYYTNNSPSYQWKLNGNDVGTNSSNYSQTGFTNGDVITCDVVSTEICSSPAIVTLSMTVSVYDVSSATLSVDGPSQVCSGTSPGYYANATNAGLHPSYQWKLNGNDVGTNQSAYTPDANAVNDVITCVLTTDPVCGAPVTVPASNSITVTAIVPVVVPTISIAASNPLTSLSNTFTATITNGGNSPGYNWYKNGSYVGNGNTYQDAALVIGDVIYCILYSDAACANPSSPNSNSLTVVAPPSYCTPSSNQGNQPCDYVWLTNVQMGTSLNKSTVCDGFYSNFTATDTLKAAAGETVNYSITGDGINGSNWYHRRAVYIDFNNDKDFVAGEMVLDLYAGALDNTSGTFTLPSPLAAGNYRMRVIASNDIDFSSCHTNGGEAEDYTLTITYCRPQSPNNYPACQYYYINNVTLGSSVDNTTACDGFYSDFSASQTLSSAAGQTVTYSFNEGSIDGQNWGSSISMFIDYNQDGDFNDAGETVADNLNFSYGTPTTGSFAIPALLAPGSYRIRVFNTNLVTNACELDYGEAEDYTLLITEPTYCTPVISEPCGLWLSQVDIGLISNSNSQPTICTAGGYADYTASYSTTAAPGSTVNFSIVGGSSIGQQWQSADIFVDFNNDGDFDDDGERVAQGFGFYAGFAYTGTFSIPSDQAYGYYRIRVKSYNADSNVDTYSGPCGNNSNGAVHDYRLIVNCVPNGSNVVVQGNNVDIADGDNTPDLADFTDFGNVEVNTSFSRTFTIKNTGTGPLQISNPTFNGGFQFNFNILNYPTSYLLQPNESTSFTVQMNMPSWAYNYAVYTTVHVPTDNCDKKDYDFAIKATGSCPAGGPDANLQGNSIDIPVGTGAVSTVTGTDFGTVNTGSTVSHTFTVQNLGVADLNISGAIFHPVYNGNGHFAFTTQPASVVPAGSSTTFTIAFAPMDASSDFAYVYIQSDDCDESSYAFTVQGSGSLPPCTPHSWTSAANNGNWDDAANWCDAVVPAATDDVIITAGNTPYPALSTNAAIQNLEIQSGATVTVGGNTLTVNGTVTGPGTLSVTQVSTIETNASTSLLFTPGNNTLKNLTVNAGTTTLGNALNITAGTALPNSTGTVTVIQGAVLAANSNLTFKSNEFGTARLAQGSDAGNFVTGNATIERYIPDNGFRSWRLLSVPTHSSGQTIRQAWQEGNANPNPFDNNLPGYGTQITSTGALATGQAAGFDNVAANAAMLFWNVNAWSPVTNTNTAIDNKKAYFLYVRGERSKGVSGAADNSSATTLRTKGNIYTGSQDITVDANSFTLVPNLYPSAIEFAGLTRTGVSNLFYIWDSKKQNNNSLGIYQTFSGTNNYNCLVSGGSYVLGQPNTLIESGQAFFVQGNSTGGSITLHESSKRDGSSGLGFRPSPSSVSKLETRLYDADGITMRDAASIVFDNAYSNAVEAEDAPKLGNPGENFAIETGSKILSVEGRQPINSDDIIQLRMWNLKQQTYSIEIAPQHFAAPGLEAFIEDAYLKTSTPVDMANNTVIKFTVDGNTGSSAANRFKIIFKKTTSAAQPSITVYPNPVEGNSINLQFTNKEKGRYQARLLTSEGKAVAAKSFEHTGGISLHTINLQGYVASGIYLLEIMAPDKNKQVLKVAINNKK